MCGAVLLAGLVGCATLAGLDEEYSVGQHSDGGGQGQTVTSPGTGAPTGSSSGTGGSVGQGNGGSSTGSGASGGTGGSGAGASGGQGGTGGTGGTTYAVVETIPVSSDGTIAESSTVLTNGVTYRLRASGEFVLSPTRSWAGDAEYWWDTTNPAPLDAYDQGGYTDVGLGVDDLTPDTDKLPDWGPYQSSHVYMIDFMGAGSTIELRIWDEVYGNNVGALQLEILAPQ